MPDNSDSYLHRVGRAGRFGTKGLAITFVSKSMKKIEDVQTDYHVLDEIQSRFALAIKPLPDCIDVSTYMNA